MKRAKLIVVVISVFVLSSFALQNSSGNNAATVAATKGASAQNARSQSSAAQGATTQLSPAQSAAPQAAPTQGVPQQIFGLLKVESAPRYVVYSWGQALKPADRSVVMSGTYSGLCTNYQISAEYVTRTVFRVEGAPKNPNIIVESYNIMGPD